MSTEPERKGTPTSFEVQVITPGEQWFDPIGVRFFINGTKQPIKIGFSHNVRTVEMIAILDITSEDIKSDKLKALEGEIVEEEDYGGE